jgi:basic membrane lipoprotein Med (substrate-binding protein (PBP1-ABC) superfamily)
MRLRYKPWARPELAACDFYVNDPPKYLGQWHKLFEKEQQIHLELGCGKGGFISKLASANPNINYIVDQWFQHKTTGAAYDAPKEKIWFPMAQGSQDIAPFHDLDSKVPQAVKDKLAEVKQQIMDGTFVVPLDESTPVSDE